MANVRIGISFISVSNAKNNLMAPQATGPSGRCVEHTRASVTRLPSARHSHKHNRTCCHTTASFTSFADAKSAAQAKWEGMLGRVTVGTDSNTAAVDVVSSHTGTQAGRQAHTPPTPAHIAAPSRGCRPSSTAASTVRLWRPPRTRKPTCSTSALTSRSTPGTSLGSTTRCDRCAFGVRLGARRLDD